LRKKLLEEIRGLRETDLGKLARKRVKEFKAFRRTPARKIFEELCFCLLTANYSAERALKIQQEVGDGFLKLSKPRLAKKLKSLGHRFPNARAKYIVEARKHVKELPRILNSLEGSELRDWFVVNVKGLGLKEASHFLRNVGFTDYAIIDFHILDVLAEYELIEKPKNLSKKKYLMIEELLGGLAADAGLNLAELDLYLWSMETGKILK